MDPLSAHLVLGGIALLVGGLVASVTDRARPAVGRDLGSLTPTPSAAP